MQRIPLLILAFIIATTAVGISASPQQPAGKSSAPELDMQDSRLDQIEPSAGTDTYPDPYIDPDLEQDNKNKRDWWRGDEWAPPQEDNPYQKW